MDESLLRFVGLSTTVVRDFDWAPLSRLVDAFG